MKLSNILIPLFLLFTHVAFADTVKLKNGDWITGTVVKKESEKLLFKTEYAGEIAIVWTEIASLKTDQAVSIVLADDASVKARMESQSLGRVKLLGSGLKTTTTLNMNDVVYINPSAQLTGEGFDWKGHLNIGGAVTQGNTDTSVLRIDGETIARSQKSRITLTGYANRAKNKNVETEFNSKGKLQYDRFVSKKWFVYANSALENDEFRDIRLRTILGFGSGYQIFEQPDRHLSVEAGINYIYTDFDLAQDTSYSSARWSLRYDELVFQGVKFFHQHEVLMSVKETDNLLVFSQTGLRVPIAEGLNASTQLNVDYAGQPAAGRVKTDKTLLFSLGYGW